MWRELILKTAPDVELGPGADETALTAVEQALGQPLPTGLASLLRECDGVTLRGVSVVWPAERIVKDNLDFRGSEDFVELYMPFEPLMFVGDNGGGDQFAFVRKPEREEAFVWDHETDARYPAAFSLRQYLERALQETGDWYR